jgi:hypothetical protein
MFSDLIGRETGKEAKAPPMKQNTSFKDLNLLPVLKKEIVQ